MDKNCRLHRDSGNHGFLGKTHNLVEFFKAYLVGGAVEHVKQIDNNRIVEIRLKKSKAIYNIIIRLWGGFPNIIITDENYSILHLHRKSSKKNELPGSRFCFPQKRDESKQYQLKEHNYDSYNSFIEAEYLNSIEEEKRKKKLKRAEQYQNKRIKEIDRQIIKLSSRLDKYSDSERYKVIGDLIISNIYKLKKGDSILEAEDYTTGELITIKLNPELTPQENSASYYKKHKKALSGIDKTKSQIEQLKREKIELEESNPEDIELPSVENQENKKVHERPGLIYRSGEWQILVGRSAKENEALLRRWVKGNDMWLHVRDYPGGYVFIKSVKGKTIPLEVLLDAGNIALDYSKAKKNGKGNVYYTQVKYLRRVKKGKPGQVIPTMDKNLYISLDDKRLDRIYSRV